MDRTVDRRTLFKLFAGASVAAAATTSPLLSTAASFGRIETFTELPNHPEVGDVQVIGNTSSFWDGDKWVARGLEKSVDPVVFHDAKSDYVWTVYPGWEAAYDQVVMCHTCYASIVADQGDTNGWWIRPANGAHAVCGRCGRGITLIGDIGSRSTTAFVKKEPAYMSDTVYGRAWNGRSNGGVYGGHY
jgi:hypothetical protein